MHPNEQATEKLHRYCDEITQWLPAYQVRLMNEDHLRLVHKVDDVGLAKIDPDWFAIEWTAALERHLISGICGWEGAPDIEITDGGYADWVCPRCGTEHSDLLAGA